MALTDAIAGLAAARGMKPVEVVDSIAGVRNRATVYRVLSGDTIDPRLGTLLELCEALDVTPGELLRLAGLLEAPADSSTAVDLGLRQALGAVQALGADDRRLVVKVVRTVIDERGRGRPAEPLRPAQQRRAAHEGGDGPA